jgi:mono/diheme cytochrome c family protein
MRTLLLVLLVGSVGSLTHAQSILQGRVDAGKAAWSGRPPIAYCGNCHGAGGQGGFAPELAGRELTLQQFTRAVRQPWGVMPAFPDLTDQTLADMHAYLASLPRAKEAGNPRPAPPEGSPQIQKIWMSMGCGQCHGPEASDPRRDLGGWAADVTFETFAKVVHDNLRPTYAVQQPKPNRMGNFSRVRIPEIVLRQIYTWLKDETGFRAPLWAEIGPGAVSGANTTYTLHLENDGHKGKGLAAEDITIALLIPPGAKVVSATGTGYQGVRPDSEAGGDTALWRVPKIAAAEKQTYTLTLTGVSGATGIFKGSTIRWNRPALRRPAGQVMKDARIPDTGDFLTTTGQAQLPTGQVRPLFMLPPDTP